MVRCGAEAEVGAGPAPEQGVVIVALFVGYGRVYHIDLVAAAGYELARGRGCRLALHQAAGREVAALLLAEAEATAILAEEGDLISGGEGDRGNEHRDCLHGKAAVQGFGESDFDFRLAGSGLHSSRGEVGVVESEGSRQLFTSYGFHFQRADAVGAFLHRGHEEARYGLQIELCPGIAG